MAVDKFKLVDGEKVRLMKAVIADDTVIEAGDLVELSAGLVIKATATGTAVAWCPDGHASGDGTSCEITVGNDFTLKTTGDEVFAATYRGGEYDINTTTQYIDYAASTLDILKVHGGVDAGTVGTAAGVIVRINKPIF
jgi:hypothetical protein